MYFVPWYISLLFEYTNTPAKPIATVLGTNTNDAYAPPAPADCQNEYQLPAFITPAADIQCAAGEPARIPDDPNPKLASPLPATLGPNAPPAVAAAPYPAAFFMCAPHADIPLYKVLAECLHFFALPVAPAKKATPVKCDLELVFEPETTSRRSRKDQKSLANLTWTVVGATTFK